MHSSFGPADPRYPRSEELGRKITEYKAWLNAGECQWLTMIREFDQEGLWQLDGIHSCAHWLSWRCGLGLNAAREKVRVAQALGSLSKVNERYAKGELSYSKVRAITRIATPESEDYLLMIAEHGTASHVEGLVARFRRCKRLEEARNAVKQHADRELRYQYDDDGSLTFRGRFPAEQGELILKALEFAMERAEVEVRAERKHLIEAAATAEESGETSEAAEDQDLADGDSGERIYYNDASEEVRPYENFATARADAMSALAESYLAHGPKASATADRYQVIVHVSAETLKANPPAETPDLFTTDFSYLEDGPHIAAETARRIGCDASMIRLIDDENGEPLSIGRKSRVVPPAMARALRIRDDGCRFPGCTHKYLIDRHHIQHWADGGETSMKNIVQLCRFHHRLVHEHGFGCERMDDGRIVFSNPIGKEIGRNGNPISIDADPLEFLRNELPELDIDAETGVTLWRGEQIDWNLAVGHLFK